MVKELPRIINTSEYLLQGSVLDSAYPLLIERLKGLADAEYKNFSEHELVFANKRTTSLVYWHVRRSLDVGNSLYHLRYLSDPNKDDNRNCPTLVRKTIDCLATSNDMMGFLGEIGFRMQYEFVSKGVVFKKGPMKITVAKIHRVTEPGNPVKLEKVTESHLVEISVLIPSGQDLISSSVKEFADQLKP
ncbi:unnamed protein product [Soboliphyme baturini]|uniref:Mediator of RNA polymerase II transcription subunit 18 n=1 Tax=Soboliphyme baturini TaxID=241478 RepID=A0A183IYJ2_9BILA|nr:unnamed protein product [Soboliphyme baturini]